MKHLNKRATQVFLSLIEGLGAGEARKIDNAQGAYMAVLVDVLRVSGKEKLVAVAHRYEQSGDLVPDPDVEFWVTEFEGETWVVPTAIDQRAGYVRSVTLEGFRPIGVHLHGQADLTTFCNTWMANIKHQQGDWKSQ